MRALVGSPARPKLKDSSCKQWLCRSAINQWVVGSSPDWGAKPFKDLHAATLPKTRLTGKTVGSFVGMLFHNQAQAVVFVRDSTSNADLAVFWSGLLGTVGTSR